jgi:hypothetical protein
MLSGPFLQLPAAGRMTAGGDSTAVAGDIRLPEGYDGVHDIRDYRMNGS